MGSTAFPSENSTKPLSDLHHLVCFSVREGPKTIQNSWEVSAYSPKMSENIYNNGGGGFKFIYYAPY